jgi:hypothetical protein
MRFVSLCHGADSAPGEGRRKNDLNTLLETAEDNNRFLTRGAGQAVDG